MRALCRLDRPCPECRTYSLDTIPGVGVQSRPMLNNPQIDSFAESLLASGADDQDLQAIAARVALRRRQRAEGTDEKAAPGPRLGLDPRLSSTPATPDVEALRLRKQQVDRETQTVGVGGGGAIQGGASVGPVPGIDPREAYASVILDLGRRIAILCDDAATRIRSLR